jgi:hypothetical protein
MTEDTRHEWRIPGYHRVLTERQLLAARKVLSFIRGWAR